jgi:hypothetical protein
MKAASLLILPLLLAFSLHASADNGTCTLPLRPYKVGYEGSYNGWKVRSTRSLYPVDGNLQGSNWEMAIRAQHLFGSINEISKFSTDKTGRIISSHYSYEKNTIGKDKELELEFDWENNKAVFTGDKEKTLDIDRDVLDKLNYQLLLRCNLKNNREELQYNVAAKGKMEDMRFEVIGEETLKTDIGTFNTIVVKKSRDNDSRHTTIWFARDLDYTMVKLLQEKREDAQAYLLYIKNHTTDMDEILGKDEDVTQSLP